MTDWYNLKYQTLTICRDQKAAIVSSCMHAGGYSAHVQEEGAGAAVAVLPEALSPAAGVPLPSKSALWLLLFLKDMCGSVHGPFGRDQFPVTCGVAIGSIFNMIHTDSFES